MKIPRQYIYKEKNMKNLFVIMLVFFISTKLCFAGEVEDFRNLYKKYKINHELKTTECIKKIKNKQNWSLQTEPCSAINMDDSVIVSVISKSFKHFSKISNDGTLTDSEIVEANKIREELIMSLETTANNILEFVELTK